VRHPIWYMAVRKNSEPTNWRRLFGPYRTKKEADATLLDARNFIADNYPVEDLRGVVFASLKVTPIGSGPYSSSFGGPAPTKRNSSSVCADIHSLSASSLTTSSDAKARTRSSLWIRSQHASLASTSRSIASSNSSRALLRRFAASLSLLSWYSLSEVVEQLSRKDSGISFIQFGPISRPGVAGTRQCT
jgi:hypothetical protein